MRHKKSFLSQAHGIYAENAALQVSLARQTRQAFLILPRIPKTRRAIRSARHDTNRSAVNMSWIHFSLAFPVIHDRCDISIKGGDSRMFFSIKESSFVLRDAQGIRGHARHPDSRNQSLTAQCVQRIFILPHISIRLPDW